jgi:hypothetical protein
LDNRNNIEQFDDLFKQAFEHASADVPASVWQGVSTATTGAGAASQASWLSKLFGLKGAAIFGGVAVVTGAAFWMAEPADDKKAEVAGSESVIQTAEENTPVNTSVADENVYQNQLAKTKTELASSEDAQAGDANVSGSSDRVNTSDNGLQDLSGSGSFNPQTGDGGDELTAKPGPVSNIEVPVMFNIWQSRKSCCINNTVDFKCVEDVNIRSVMWKLNGEVVATNQKALTLLFDHKGEYKVELVATDVRGERATKVTSVRVNGARADFDIDQMSGELQVSSKHPWASNQWYINNVLIDGDRSTLAINDYSGEVQITHVVTGMNGCSDTLKKTTEIMTSCDIKIVDIPNVFTPYLSDGKNDEFDIELSEKASQFRLTIISPQSGEVVFETENPDEAWNGKQFNQGQLLPFGWYTYQLIYGCGDATQQKRGKVLLAQ